MPEAGGPVRTTSSIGRSLRAAAGDLTVGGRIGTDAVLAGGSVMVDQASQVGRDLVAMGGSVRVLGSVSRNAFLNGGDVVIRGAGHGWDRADPAADCAVAILPALCLPVCRTRDGGTVAARHRVRRAGRGAPRRGGRGAGGE